MKIFAIIIIAALLTACAATYNTPEAMISAGENKLTATINAEHRSVYESTLKYLRPCWDHAMMGASMRVTGDYADNNSQIFVGTYSIMAPRILFTVRLSKSGSKTEAAVYGLNAAENKKIITSMNMAAKGDTTTCE